LLNFYIPLFIAFKPLVRHDVQLVLKLILVISQLYKLNYLQMRTYFFMLYFLLSAVTLNLRLHAKIPASRIVKKIHLEGDAGWDYLYSDDQSGKLYVSHGNMVQVVDMKTDTLLGTITGLNGVHGIAIASDLNKGFISNGRDSSVTIFNTKTLQVITRIKVTGQNPDAILFDPFSRKVFTFNGRSSNSTVIDAETNLVTATIALEGKPEFSVTDGKGKVYVNIEDKSRICEINTSTFKVEQSWSIAPGEEPSGLALDNETHRLFSVCDNKTMVVLDAETGKIISTLPIGDRVDGAAFDPGLKYAYSSNGDGTLTIVKEENKDSFSIVTYLPTQKGARTIAINKITHHIYLPTAEFEQVPKSDAGNQKPRPKILPNSFIVLDIAP
jgi:YVTN family beta-propeller protein